MSADTALCIAPGGSMVATTKDRNKDGYFNRNFNQLPPAIQEQYANAKQSKKRDLVNQIIVKSDEGKW